MTVLNLSFELPAELVAALGSSDELTWKAKVAFVLELLREARIGQSRAAEILGVSREDIIDLMASHGVPSGLRTPEDVDQELETVRKLGANDPPR